MTTGIRSLADVRAILVEALAEDLPIGDHMLEWTPDEIRRYAEEGGFWSPEQLSANPGQDDAALSRATTRLAIDESHAGPSFSWESYEQHVVPLASPGGEALAAAMSDGWAVRCSQLTSLFEPQAEGSWCGIASLAIALKSLRVSGRGHTPSQHEIFKSFVHGQNIVPGGSMRHGLSMAQEKQLCEVVFAKLGLPHRVVKEEGVGVEAVASRLTAQLRQAADDDTLFLVNLLRSVPSERNGDARGMAHWSPLAGFVERHGSEPYALFLDVAAPKMGSHWLPLRLLAECICTRNMYNQPRGYLRIAAPERSC